MRAHVSDRVARLRHRWTSDWKEQLRRAYQLRRYRLKCFPHREPQMRGVVSQLCTQKQMESACFSAWCGELKETVSFHRKKWEYAYVLQALEENGMLAPGKRGLGFGMGREPLPAVMAKRGCRLVVTDWDPDSAREAGWAGGQYANSLEDLNRRGICPPDTFRAAVTHRVVDMNNIPESLLHEEFDFVWSCCALEHLGSIENGLEFVRRSLACVRPGGLAVHTTEYNISHNYFTLDGYSVVLFRRFDIERLVRELRAEGHTVRFNPHPGGGRISNYCDLPPYGQRYHIKLLLEPTSPPRLG